MRAKLKVIGRYLLAMFFLFTGVSHLLEPEIFVRIIPPFLPFPYAIAILSGVAELMLAIGLLIPKTRSAAAWLTIVFLIAIFPANIYMYMIRETEFPDLPSWVLLVRLPLQLVLMAWAYLYTASGDSGHGSGKSRISGKSRS